MTRLMKYWGLLQSELRYRLEVAQSRFWLLPLLICTLIILSNFFLVNNEIVKYLKLFTNYTSEFAHLSLILSSIATSTMTVVGVLFSITFVVLQQASAQYSPRIIENFIQSLITQCTLGMYLGTFCFSILTIYRESLGLFEKQSMVFGVLLAILLAFCSLLLTVFYVHTIAKSVKSHQLLHDITQSTIRTIRSLENIYEPIANERVLHFQEIEWRPVKSPTFGYLQKIDYDRMTQLLNVMDQSFSALLVQPGDYIFLDQNIMLTPKDCPPPDVRKLEKCFSIGKSRTHSQDFTFGIKQMVDIALRALSPGINDPHTAIESVSCIGSVLNCYGRTTLVHRYQSPKEHQNICLKEQGFVEILNLSLNEILESGKSFYSLLHAVEQTLLTLKSSLQTPLIGNVIDVKIAETQKMIRNLISDKLSYTVSWAEAEIRYR